MNDIFNNNCLKNNINDNIYTTMPTDEEMRQARKEAIAKKIEEKKGYVFVNLKAKKVPELKQMMKDRKLKLSKDGIALNKEMIVDELFNYMKQLMKSPYFHFPKNNNEMLEMLF